MTATYSFDEQPVSGHPLLPGASPAAIRDGLLSSDRGRFDEAYEAALLESRAQPRPDRVVPDSGAVAAACGDAVPAG